MNRRDMIKRGPMALLGAVAVAVGIKAAPKDKPPQRVILSVSVPMDESQIIHVVRDDYMRGGKLREAIESDREWGPLDSKYL